MHPAPSPTPIALLGADAVLAALPATPVQLAHACRALGFELAFPASWGDELVAEGCLTRLAERGCEPAIVCACPYVTERLTRAGAELAPWMLTLVAPPVAAARYIRAAYGERPVHITYVGACPAGSNSVFDARCSPEELLAMFDEQGVVLTAQPELFDSVLPPDRRRFHSLPGGAPSAQRLAESKPAHTLVELEEVDEVLVLAQRLLARRPELIDLAPRLGCVCSGAAAEGAPADARAALIALEPPRASAPVLDPAVRVDVDLPAPADVVACALAPRPAPDDAAIYTDTDTSSSRQEPDDEPGAHPLPHPWRVAAARRISGNSPMLRRTGGRVIPRAYAVWQPRPSEPPAQHRPITPPTQQPLRRGDWRHDVPARIDREPRLADAPFSAAQELGDEPRYPLPPPPTGPRRGARLRVGMLDD
jgi:hypothetical protein